MILYSIIPYEIIFSEKEIKQEPTVNLMYKGELVEAIKENDYYTIKRLISSNPKQYLNKNFTPNTKINHPNIK